MKLAEDMGFEENEFLEILELFVKTTNSYLNVLQSALEQGDIQKVIEVAHSIKGAAGSLELTDIYNIAKGIEMSAREGHLDGLSENIRLIKERNNLVAEVLARSDQEGIL
ncbi:MAG: Hpt domain-containing protein [Nitrospirota bacterium]